MQGENTMSEYEHDLAIELKLEQINNHIEEIILDAIIFALIKIRDNNSYIMKQNINCEDDPMPF
jgi:hypothetical protein